MRNRLKVQSAVDNAARVLEISAEFGSFGSYLWGWVDGEPLQSSHRRLADLPAQTPLSVDLSRDLKRRGFRFVGPTVCYAFMQAVGLVNDHVTRCYRHRELTPG